MSNPIHQFEIHSLIPFSIGGVDLAFTNSALWMVIAVVTSISFLTFSTHKKALVPGRMQVFTESLYEFVAGMIRENIGTKGSQYFPFIFTLFIVVLLGNMLGLLPYSFTYTSHIIVTAALAFMIFIVVLVVGIVNHGFRFFSLFLPPGVPWWLVPLIFTHRNHVFSDTSHHLVRSLICEYDCRAYHVKSFRRF